MSVISYELDDFDDVVITNLLDTRGNVVLTVDLEPHIADRWVRGHARIFTDDNRTVPLTARNLERAVTGADRDDRR